MVKIQSILSDNKIKLIIFAFAIIYLTIMCAPNFTWTNTDADGFSYFISAKFDRISHPTGAPLFNLITRAAIHIPVGDEFWRISMVSVVASAITAVLLYMVCRKLKFSKLSSLLAPTVFLASSLVVSQSTIVRTYALVMVFMVLMYYLHISKRNTLKYLVGSVGLMVHPMTLFVATPILISDWWNNNKALKLSAKNIACLMIPAVIVHISYFYAYNTAPYLWSTGRGLTDFINYYFGQTGMIGGLSVIPIQPLIQRIEESIWIFGGTFTVILLLGIPMIWNEIKNKAYLLSIIFLVPIIYFSINISGLTYQYIIPAVAFGSILLAKAIDKKIWKTVKPYYIFIACACLMAFNLCNYDIGKNLDPSLTATTYYNDMVSLAKTDPNAVIYTEVRGWEKYPAYIVNRLYDTNLQTPIYYYNREGKFNNMDNVTALYINAFEKGSMYRTVLIDPASDVNNDKGVRIIKVQNQEDLSAILLSKEYTDSFKKGF